MLALNTTATDAAHSSSPTRPPRRVLVLYAVGQAGMALAGTSVTNLLEYFYYPPETTHGHSLFPMFIAQGMFLGLTILGAIGSFGRFFDAILDPIIAYFSDKATFRFGKRRTFMAFSAVPFALFAWLVFCPPLGYASGVNMAWLFGMIMLYYISFTLYVVPYTALISELGHTEKDSLLISTLLSVSFAIGFVAVSSVYSLQSILEHYYPSVRAFQIAMGGLMLLAAALMFVPVVFVDENRYALTSSVMPPIREAWLRIWRNTDFRWFAISDLFYWCAITFIQKGGIYYMTVLLHLPKWYSTIFQVGILVLSFFCYIPINWASLRYGKKRMVNVSFLMLGTMFLLVPFAGKIPLDFTLQMVVLILLSFFPLATFGILQNVIVADIVRDQLRKTGTAQAGMFYAVRTMMMKFGVSLATLIFPSLLALGKSTDNDIGIRLTGVVAFVFCMIGFAVFQYYRETTME